MKKFVCALLALVVLIGVVPLSCASAANEDGFDEYDFMLVLDRSTSMLSSDPDDVSTEAAKMFIDACEFSDSRVSIVRFSLDCSISRFYTLDSLDSRDAAKKEIERMKTSSGSLVGTAMLKSVNHLIEEGAPERKKFIVLLSDGGLSSSDVTKLQEAAEICRENSIPVYVIGAQNSTWNTTDEAPLAALADETGGDFLLATSIQEVPDFFRQIFAKLRNTTIIEGPVWESDGSYHVVEVDVKDTFMSYADVNISSGKAITDVYIEDPNGNRVEFDDERFIRSSSRLYNYIRLVEPEKGTWKVYIKGATYDQIHVSYIINYAVEVVPYVTKEHMTATDYGKIGAKMFLRGTEPADRDFYEFMSTAYATVKCGDESRTITLAYDEEEGCLAAEFIPGTIGKHTVDVYVMCEYFQRQNSADKAAEFTVGNSAPEVISDIESLSLDLLDEENNIATIFYERLFKDPNGDAMTFTVQKDKRALDIVETLDYFTVTSDTPCEANITVIATDSWGASSSYTFPVSITDSSVVQRRIISACIAALVLLLLIAAFLGTRRVRGYLTVTMDGAAPKGAVTLNLNAQRRKLTLKQIITIASNRYLSEYSVPVASGFEQMVMDNRQALDSIAVTGNLLAMPGKLTFCSKSKEEQIKINGSAFEAGKRTMTEGQYFNITVEGCERYAISLNYSTRKASSLNNMGF